MIRIDKCNLRCTRTFFSCSRFSHTSSKSCGCLKQFNQWQCVANSCAFEKKRIKLQNIHIYEPYIDEKDIHRSPHSRQMDSRIAIDRRNGVRYSKSSKSVWLYFLFTFSCPCPYSMCLWFCISCWRANHNWKIKGYWKPSKTIWKALKIRYSILLTHFATCRWFLMAVHTHWFFKSYLPLVVRCTVSSYRSYALYACRSMPVVISHVPLLLW